MKVQQMKLTFERAGGDLGCPVERMSNDDLIHDRLNALALVDPLHYRTLMVIGADMILALDVGFQSPHARMGGTSATT